ncbi:MAG: hypothetical protein ABIQ74_12875 [Chitinophagales bacterium]
MNVWKYFLILSLTILACRSSFATDRNFAYTNESRTLQGGLRELEAWISYSYGRDNFYSAVKNRVEFEIGLGKKLQTSFYLNLNAETFPQTIYNPVTDSSGSIIFQQQSVLHTKFNAGFSNEWKYQLSDPVVNKIGSALYGEISISPDGFELETKFILDKKFNRFVTALNFVSEIEWEAEDNTEGETEWEQEFKPEINFGLIYELPNNFSLGFEARSLNIIHEGIWEHSALFAGPAFSYKQNDWWVSIGIQPQITDFKSSGLDLEDHEKLNARMLFAYSF